MSLAIDRALSVARGYDDVDPASVQEATHELLGKRQRLLGVEQHSREQMDRQIATLYREQKRAEHWRRHRLLVLDDEVLRWRKRTDQGFDVPQLAVSTLDDPLTQFHVVGQWLHHDVFSLKERGAYPVLPERLAQMHHDVLRGMVQYAERNKVSVTASSVYGGVIPDHARQAIEDAPFELSEMYLLREAQWEVKVTKEPRPAAPPRPKRFDPIVIGYDEGTMYVVTVFDPTPLEEYVVAEFAALGSPVRKALGVGDGA